MQLFPETKSFVIENVVDENKLPTSTQKPIEESESKPKYEENSEPDELSKIMVLEPSVLASHAATS